jgi:hypothetical protein
VRFELREVPRGSFDGELAVAAVGLVMLVGVVALRVLPESCVPDRPCTFHQVTGKPCLTCGGTRAARALGHFRFAESLSHNPLVALWLIVALPHALWVAAARIWHLPRPRVRCERRGEKWALAALLLLIVAANWAYLIWAGV